MNEDCLVTTRSPLSIVVLRHAAEQNHSRGAAASWIVPMAAQFDKDMKENERKNQT